MPLENGIWTEDEAAIHHDFSYCLAKWIGEYLPKNQRLADIGCGPAWYLRYFHDIGFESLIGFEGTKQNFAFGDVTIADLTKPLPPYKGEGHNVICLEVGEHIPEYGLQTFIDNLAMVTGIGKLILSWAVPEQDGIGHVSCRHNIWVIDQMEKRGFKLLVDDTLTIRTVVENRFSYFRNTLMIFKRG